MALVRILDFILLVIGLDVKWDRERGSKESRDGTIYGGEAF